MRIYIKNKTGRMFKVDPYNQGNDSRQERNSSITTDIVLFTSKIDRVSR